MKPPRRVVLGPFSALEPELLAAVRTARAAGGALAPVPVLVPSNLLRAHLQALLARQGGVLNVRFHLIPDLARALAPGLLEAPAYLDELVLETLLEAAESTAGPFAEVRERPGLRRALLDVFADLGEAGIEPGDLVAAARRIARGMAAAEGARLLEVARLFAAYRAALAARGFLETTDVVARAAAGAAGAALVRAAPAVLVYGFYDFTAVQLRLVEALAAAVATTVFFPWVDAPAFAYARPALDALRGLGFVAEPASGGGGGSGGAVTSRDAPASLRALRDRLFRPPSGRPVASDGALAIVSCPGEAREAREVARRLAAAARADGDLAFERVAVLPRRLAGYRRRLATALAGHGVPAVLPRLLGEQRAGRTLAALLAVRRSDLGRREVMALLDVAELPAEAGASDRSVAYWDRLSREAGVVAGRRDWADRLEAYARSRASAAPGPAAAARALARFVAGLAVDLEEIPLRGRPSAFAGAASRLLSRFTAADDAQAGVLDALAALARLDAADRDLALDRFAALAGDALATASLPAGELRPLVKGVLVADLMAARGVPFDLVVLPGLVEREFPAPPREDPVLRDAERTAIGGALGRPEALRPKGDRVAEERLLFALACGAARKRLVLTFPRIETGTARERVPSSFLLAVAEALTGKRADYGALARLAQVERVALVRQHPDRPEQAETDVEYDLATAALAAPGEALGLAVDCSFFLRGLACDRDRWSPRLGRFDGLVGALAGPAGGDPLSPTRLETYARCPLRYFFHYALGLSRLDDPVRAIELQAADRGRIVHAILRSFLSGLTAAGGSLLAAPPAALERDLVAAAEREFDLHQATGVVGPSFLWDLEKAAIREDLKRWLDAEVLDQREHGLIPRLFEVRFGPRFAGGEGAAGSGGGEPEDEASRDEPVRFDLGDGGVLAFRGKIDRIDVDAGGQRFRVIDYKTGAVGDARPETIRGGRALQLPVYLLAGRALLAGRGIEPGEGEAQYHFLSRRGGGKRIAYSERDRDAKLAALRQAVAIIAGGIAAGRFHAEPEEELCRRCDFLRICGSSRFRLAERKADDRERAPFVKLREIE